MPNTCCDTPVDQGLGHHVTDGALVDLLRRQADVDAVVALLDGKGLDAVVVPRRLTGERVVVPTVPGAAQQAVLDGALAQGAALVRAGVVQRAVLAVEAGHAQGAQAAGGALDPAVGEFVLVQDLLPDERFIGGCHWVGLRVVFWSGEDGRS
jgi:hypothetical protein